MAAASTPEPTLHQAPVGGATAWIPPTENVANGVPALPHSRMANRNRNDRIDCQAARGTTPQGTGNALDRTRCCRRHGLACPQPERKLALLLEQPELGDLTCHQ